MELRKRTRTVTEADYGDWPVPHETSDSEEVGSASSSDSSDEEIEEKKTGVLCNACREWKPKDAFSKKQLTKVRAAARWCTQCITEKKGCGVINVTGLGPKDKKQKVAQDLEMEQSLRNVEAATFSEGHREWFACRFDKLTSEPTTRDSQWTLVLSKHFQDKLGSRRFGGEQFVPKKTWRALRLTLDVEWMNSVCIPLRGFRLNQLIQPSPYQGGNKIHALFYSLCSLRECLGRFSDLTFDLHAW